MFIDLNNLKIECKTCEVLTPVRQVRHWHNATWVVSFACESCEEKQTEQENKAIEDNYEDFVKNERNNPNSPDFEPEFCDFCTDPSRCSCSHNRGDNSEPHTTVADHPFMVGFGNRKTIEEIRSKAREQFGLPRGKSTGRPIGSKDSAPRAVCRCSRCGTRGRRISPLRGGRCVACEHMDVIV